MEWIKVEDRLPGNDELCVIVNGQGDIDIALFYKGKFMRTDENGYQFHEKYTTHWIQLPKLPQ